MEERRCQQYVEIGHLRLRLYNEEIQRCVACSTIGPHDWDLFHQKTEHVITPEFGNGTFILRCIGGLVQCIGRSDNNPFLPYNTLQLLDH
jgi:hypothetical protein